MCAGEWRASIETCGGIVSIEGDGNAAAIEESDSAASIEGDGSAASIEGGGNTASIEGGGNTASIEGDGNTASIEGADAPYEDWLRQCFYPLPVPHKKNEPPMRGSSALPEFVPKTAGSRFGAMILELKTGRKRNKGSKRIGIRETQQLSVTHKKNEPPMRGSSALPEFVPKTAGSRFGAMILELKTGRKRNKGSKRIGIRESLCYRAATRF